MRLLNSANPAQKKSLPLAVVLFVFCSLFASLAFAQAPKPFAAHEIIETGGGQKIEILKCRGEGPLEECDCIYYTDKRQNGKRMWQNANRIREEQKAGMLEVNAAKEAAQRAADASAAAKAKEAAERKAAKEKEVTASTATNEVMRTIKEQNAEMKAKGSLKATEARTTSAKSPNGRPGAQKAMASLSLKEIARQRDSINRVKAALEAEEAGKLNNNENTASAPETTAKVIVDPDPGAPAKETITEQPKESEIVKTTTEPAANEKPAAIQTPEPVKPVTETTKKAAPAEEDTSVVDFATLRKMEEEKGNATYDPAVKPATATPPAPPKTETETPAPTAEQEPAPKPKNDGQTVVIEENKLQVDTTVAAPSTETTTETRPTEEPVKVKTKKEKKTKKPKKEKVEEAEKTEEAPTAAPAENTETAPATEATAPATETTETKPAEEPVKEKVKKEKKAKKHKKEKVKEPEKTEEPASTPAEEPSAAPTTDSATTAPADTTATPQQIETQPASTETVDTTTKTETVDDLKAAMKEEIKPTDDTVVKATEESTADKKKEKKAKKNKKKKTEEEPAPAAEEPATMPAAAEPVELTPLQKAAQEADSARKAREKSDTTAPATPEEKKDIHLRDGQEINASPSAMKNETAPADAAKKENEMNAAEVNSDKKKQR